MAFVISGSFLKLAEHLNHSLFGIAGKPLTTFPASIFDTMPVFELAITLSPTLTLLLTPTCPARITASPI